ncbi:MAG: serine/threonine dehydratase [Rickettsiaceae bacterium]|jgi:threonine dehydratase|nr:serine/threonine dehydratase [Rickettsiaceae bacterium]
MSLSLSDIQKAQNRIENYIKKTPVLTDQFLNQKLGAEIYFKCENFQITGSFKLRGATNKLLRFKEQNGHFPEKIVAVSSGNHAQAVAYLGQKFGIQTLIYMEENASPYKIKAARKYGAEIALTKTKKETEIFAEERIKEGYFYIHSSNDEDLLCGQGTSCLEALQEIGDVDAIFTPCGGGGLIAGTYLASQMLKNKAKVFAAEPLAANDTAISYRTGKIYSFETTPISIADGAKTLKPSAITFPYIQKLDDIYEIEEEEIIKWTQITSCYLKIFIEPTSALAVAAMNKFLQQNQGKKQKILIILSGGNMSQDTAARVWKEDYLSQDQ